MKTFGPKFLSTLTPRPYYWRYLLTYASFLLGSSLAKIKIRGHHNLPKKGPFVIASNHFSDYDPLFITYAIRKPICFIAASDQEIEWIFAWAPFLYGRIPIDRKKVSPSTIKMSIGALKKGEILGVFPDGGVSYNLLSKPKKGAVFLSTLGEAPIVPISIYGAERAWEGAINGIRSKVCINIGRPFGPYKLKRDKKHKTKQINKIGQNMMCRIAALLPKNRRGIIGSDEIIKKHQYQNNIIPDHHHYFKKMKEGG